MAETATPTMPPPKIGASRVRPLAATMKPSPAPTTAMSSEMAVRTGSKPTGAPGSYASIATKCVHQIEDPAASAVRKCHPVRCNPVVPIAR